jgi:hypothetical protein
LTLISESRAALPQEKGIASMANRLKKVTLTAGAAVAATALGLGAPAAFAETDHVPGATLSATSGGSATTFTVNTPSGAFCPGDTATQGYSVNSYLVPDHSPEIYPTVNYPGGTPTGPGNVVYDDLTAPDFTPYVSEQTQPAVAPATTGLLPSPALLTFGAYGGFFGPPGPGIFLSPGIYDVGLACADKNGNVTDTWNVQVQFFSSQSDPGGFTWSVFQPAQAPESPLAIALPLAALAVIGGAGVLMVRRRRQHNNSAQAA